MRLVDAGHTWVKFPASTTSRRSVLRRMPTAVPSAPPIAAPRRRERDGGGLGLATPHGFPTGGVPMPNDADLLDMFAGWAADHQTIKQILVRNPRELYGF